MEMNNGIIMQMILFFCQLLSLLTTECDSSDIAVARTLRSDKYFMIASIYIFAICSCYARFLTFSSSNIAKILFRTVLLTANDNINSNAKLFKVPSQLPIGEIYARWKLLFMTIVNLWIDMRRTKLPAIHVRVSVTHASIVTLVKSGISGPLGSLHRPAHRWRIVLSGRKSTAKPKYRRFRRKTRRISLPRTILKSQLLLLLPVSLSPHHLSLLFLWLTRAHVTTNPPIHESIG